MEDKPINKQRQKLDEQSPNILDSSSINFCMKFELIIFFCYIKNRLYTSRSIKPIIQSPLVWIGGLK